MIDIDKYEGTNWDLRGQFTHTEMADEVLLLLAEVKRLRKDIEGLQAIWNYLDPKGYAWEEEEFVAILKEYGFYGEGEMIE